MIAKAMYTAMFYALALVSVLLAMRVVSSPRLLRAAIALMVVLVASAGFYVLLGYEFLAGVQVLVYVGGVAIFIVFAIMLTSTMDLLEDAPPLHRKVLGMIVSVVFFGVTTAALLWTKFPVGVAGTPPKHDAHALGLKLLDYGAKGFVIPFELISLLLLAAVIGGIVLGRKVPPPGQPFTSGGDRSDEVRVVLPQQQLHDDELTAGKGGR